RPTVRTPPVRVQIEERTRAGVPLATVVEHLGELLRRAPIAIDDEHVAIAAAAQVDVARVASLDPVRLGHRLVRNRVEGNALIRGVIDAAVLTRILKLDSPRGHRTVNEGVRKAVCLHAASRDVTAE